MCIVYQRMMSELEHAVPSPLPSLARQQRSLSLPGPGLRQYGAIPSLAAVQQTRGGWEKLGLYMKGVPPKPGTARPRPERSSSNISSE